MSGKTTTHIGAIKIFKIVRRALLKTTFLPHLTSDICVLLEEFVVVSQLMIFLSELLGLAKKPMASPSNSERKIVS